jgi:hypothetical protein
MDGSLTPFDYLLKAIQIANALFVLFPVKLHWKLVAIPVALGMFGPYFPPAFEGLRTGDPNAEAAQKLQLENLPKLALAIWIVVLATLQSHTLFVAAVEPLRDWIPPCDCSSKVSPR